MTEEGRRKLSELMKARWSDPSTRESLEAGLRTRKRMPSLTDEVKAKISASRAVTWRNEDSRQRQCKAQSAGQKAAWADPEKAAARLEKCRQTRLAKQIASGLQEPTPTTPATTHTALPRTTSGEIDVNHR